MNLVSISRGGAGDWLHGAGINLARIHSASCSAWIAKTTSSRIHCGSITSRAP
jgi:hypothetical protein